jgi:hypothetical protein
LSTPDTETPPPVCRLWRTETCAKSGMVTDKLITGLDKRDGAPSWFFLRNARSCAAASFRSMLPLMTTRRFPEVDALIRRVETKAAGEPDRLTAMIAVITMVIASDTDPYLLIGSLLTRSPQPWPNAFPPRHAAIYQSRPSGCSGTCLRIAGRSEHRQAPTHAAKRRERRSVRQSRTFDHKLPDIRRRRISPAT